MSTSVVVPWVTVGPGTVTVAPSQPLQLVRVTVDSVDLVTTTVLHPRVSNGIDHGGVVLISSHSRSSNSNNMGENVPTYVPPCVTVVVYGQTVTVV